jgi:hypothetical protein
MTGSVRGSLTAFQKEKYLALTQFISRDRGVNDASNSYIQLKLQTIHSSGQLPCVYLLTT